MLFSRVLIVICVLFPAPKPRITEATPSLPSLTTVITPPPVTSKLPVVQTGSTFILRGQAFNHDLHSFNICFFIPINKSIATSNSYSVVHIMLKLGNERDLEI